MSRAWEVNWFGEQFFVLATKANITATTKAAHVVERAAKKIMGTGASRIDLKTPSKARFSRKAGGGAYHRPSAPGFPPNIDTGVLKSSISTEIIVKGESVEGWVGSNRIKMRTGLARQGISAAKSDVEYGYYLEVGTRKMQKRPWLRPALLKSRRLIRQIFYTAFAK